MRMHLSACPGPTEIKECPPPRGRLLLQQRALRPCGRGGGRGGGCCGSVAGIRLPFPSIPHEALPYKIRYNEILSETRCEDVDAAEGIGLVRRRRLLLLLLLLMMLATSSTTVATTATATVTVTVTPNATAFATDASFAIPGGGGANRAGRWSPPLPPYSVRRRLRRCRSVVLVNQLPPGRLLRREKRSLFSSLIVCLSRACLGKMSVFLFTGFKRNVAVFCASVWLAPCRCSGCTGVNSAMRSLL